MKSFAHLTELRTPIITLSGADEHTDLVRLSALNAEIGLLYTATPEGRARYPSREWLGHAVQVLPHTAIHICGSGARAELKAGALGDLLTRARRIQVNGIVTVEEAEAICEKYPLHLVMTQHNDVNAGLLAVRAKNHAILIDASGGRGILPSSWQCEATDKIVGYAGGLGPTNLAEQLPRILEVAKWPFWIDMEGQLRENDRFSIERAYTVVGMFNHAITLAAGSRPAKTCKEIEIEYRESHSIIFGRHQQEIQQAKERQFTVGARVVWSHGLLTVRGKVTRIPDYNDDSVMVKRNGAKHEMPKRAYELENELPAAHA